MCARQNRPERTNVIFSNNALLDRVIQTRLFFLGYGFDMINRNYIGPANRFVIF